MPCDFDPQQPVGGSPLAPAAPPSPQDIAEMRRVIDAAADAPEREFEDSVWQMARNVPRLLDAVEALTAANARLTSEIAAKQAALDIVWAENSRLNWIEQAATQYVDTHPTFRHLVIRRLFDAVQSNQERDWYEGERRRVEADHAAAVQAKRDAQRAEDDDALSAVAMRDLYDAAGIDMDLLGELCSEEPDADTKREVAEMMDGLNDKDGD